MRNAKCCMVCDPPAPTRRKWIAPAWSILEFLPKSVRRREDGPPAIFRRAWLFGIWYLPLFEPRHIPDDHEVDPSESAHPR